jgi:endonuclease YncB( thermonuclease family)
MPFTLIQGVFRPHSGLPDGDSVRFEASNDRWFDEVVGDIQFKENGEVQLRYEGIDALEKAALKPFSSDATAMNLSLLDPQKSGAASLPGYILSSHADTNGRPVCFVFAGKAPKSDGTTVKLEADGLQESVNYQLVQQGLVYPMFYDGLYKELRDSLISATQTAREEKLGIWKRDRTTAGFKLEVPPDMAELPPIFPKLWRRLEKFYSRRSNQTKTPQDFMAWLRQQPDRLVTLSDRRAVRFVTVLELKGTTLKMLYPPEALMFL